MDAAAFAPPPGRPKNWDKRVSAAYLRMLGLPQKAVASAIGASRRSLQYWEGDTVTWSEAREEAAIRWLTDLVDAARKTVLDAVRAGDVEIGFKILERTIDALAPPKTRVEVNIPWDHLDDDALRRLAAGEDPARVLSLWHRNGSTPAPE